jgi:hypothetical protein
MTSTTPNPNENPSEHFRMKNILHHGMSDDIRARLPKYENYIPPDVPPIPIDDAGSISPPREPTETESDEHEPPQSRFIFDRRDYTFFVFLTLLIWFVVVALCLHFRIQLIFSVETLREMTGDGITLAGIPFALLSVLAVLGKNQDNYLKIALAATATVFLIISFACFLALWRYGDYEPAITQTYSIYFFIAFAGAFVIQISWFVVSNNETWRKPLGLTYHLRLFFDASIFIVSFLYVQVSVSRDAQYKLIPFIWVGFAGGLTALVILILISVTKLPVVQEDS